MTKLRLVFNVEEETLIDDKFFIQKGMLNHIAMVLSNVRNSENDVVLITAGAIASGIEQAGLKKYPVALSDKQALAAIGQVELIKRYQNIFDEYTQMIAQVLLARDIINNPKQQFNAKNTFKKLLSLGIIPVINENDTISTADIEVENNYMLTVTVANILSAHALVQINKDLSFNVLCKGEEFSYYCKDKDVLFKLLRELQKTNKVKRGFQYPSVFPQEMKKYK